MINLFGKFKGVKPLKTGNNIIFFSKDMPDELDRLQYTGDEGNIIFCKDELKEAVIKAIENKRPGVYDDKKWTDSQRLRGFIFQAFIKKYPEHTALATKESEEAWAKAYHAAMEVHCNYWKDKI